MIKDSGCSNLQATRDAMLHGKNLLGARLVTVAWHLMSCRTAIGR